MEAKEYNFKLGDPVLCRYPHETAWRIAIWGDSITHDSDGYVRTTLEFISLEGNEHMHGTRNDMKPKRWRAFAKGQYFCIATDGSILSCEDEYLASDNLKHAIGNYFKTEGEAKDALQKLTNLLTSE